MRCASVRTRPPKSDWTAPIAIAIGAARSVICLPAPDARRPTFQPIVGAYRRPTEFLILGRAPKNSGIRRAKLFSRRLARSDRVPRCTCRSLHSKRGSGLAYFSRPSPGRRPLGDCTPHGSAAGPHLRAPAVARHPTQSTAPYSLGHRALVPSTCRGRAYVTL